MIRNYTESDYETLVSIANRAWAKIFEGYRKQLGDAIFSQLYLNPAQSKAVQIRKHAENHPDWFYVAERNGKVVGFITFVLIRDRGLGIISNNAADADSGEKGIGQEMYAAVLDRFRAEGMRIAQVTTGLDEGHTPARKAYERAGFKMRTEAVTYCMEL